MNQFRPDFQDRNFYVVAGGHINFTYKVVEGSASFLLQGINTEVFSAPEKIFENQKTLQEFASSASTTSPILPQLQSLSGDYKVEDAASGVWWRLADFVEGVCSYDFVQTPIQSFEAARGYGKFLASFISLSPSRLQETLTNFHNPAVRFQQLEDALLHGKKERIAVAKKVVGRLKELHWVVEKWTDFVTSGLPLRVCHNDTKLSNVLLYQKTDGLAFVIDLDTTMPGYVMYDFGDMMRSFVCPVKENEVDLSKIELNLENYRAMVKGFLQETHTFLTQDELSSLNFGGILLTYLMALRFLADFLIGDKYYATTFENENLARTKNQLRRITLFLNNSDQLESIIQEEYHLLK